MKTKILPLLLFNICLLNAQVYKTDKKKGKDSANDRKKELVTKVVTYDFKEGEFKKVTTSFIKHNQPIVLKIININRLAYQTSINANDVRIVDENLSDSLKKAKNFVNDDIATIILEADQTKNFDSKILKVEVNRSNNVKKNDEVEKELMKLKQNLKNLEREKNDLQINLQSLRNENLNKENQLKDTLQKKRMEVISTEKYDLIKSINFTEEKVKIKENSIEGLKKDIEEKEFLLNEKDLWQNKYNKLIERIQKKSSDFSDNTIIIQNIVSAYGNYIDFIKNPMLDKNLYILERDKYVIVKNHEDYYGYLKDYSKSYNDLIKLLNSNTLNEILENLKKNDSSKYLLANMYISQVRKYIEDTYSKLNVTQINRLINNTQITDAVLKLDETYQFVSNPIQSMEDMVEFNVKIKKGNEESFVKNFTYKEYVQKGVRWDFSAGAVFDFGIKRQTYDLQNAGFDNNRVKIVENNRNQFYPSLAGILHSSFRMGRTVTWALSFGASLDISEFKLNSFFPGLSLMLGKREKTIITVGPSFSNVTQLKKYYSVNELYDKTLDVSSITTNNFKVGYFAGITYNLTNKQRTKIKILQ